MQCDCVERGCIYNIVTGCSRESCVWADHLEKHVLCGVSFCFPFAPVLSLSHVVASVFQAPFQQEMIEKNCAYSGKGGKACVKASGTRHEAFQNRILFPAGKLERA